MKKYIIILLFSPILIFGQEKTSKEEFKPFLQRFYSDSVFQFSRIVFPLEGGELGGGDYIPQDIADSLGIEVDNRTEWKKNEFNQKLHSVVDYGQDYHTEYREWKNYVEEKLYLNASGYYEIRRFELINNKWFLTYYYLNNF